MNLIFPLIVVLFFFCILTVIKSKKAAVRLSSVEGQPFRIQMTDKRNLSDGIDQQKTPEISQHIESNQKISISFTMDGNRQNLFRHALAEDQEADSDIGKFASDLTISIDIIQ